jgi:hypothetical protein
MYIVGCFIIQRKIVCLSVSPHCPTFYICAAWNFSLAAWLTVHNRLQKPFCMCLWAVLLRSQSRPRWVCPSLCIRQLGAADVIWSLLHVQMAVRFVNHTWGLWCRRAKVDQTSHTQLSFFFSFFLDISILEDETSRLSRNVRHTKPSDAASYPSRTDTSSTPQRKPKNSQSYCHLRVNVLSRGNSVQWLTLDRANKVWFPAEDGIHTHTYTNSFLNVTADITDCFFWGGGGSCHLVVTGKIV